MFKIIIITVGLIALSACAARVPKVHSGNRESVVISRLHAGNSKDAIVLADAHCAKYGRSATIHPVLEQSGAFVFRCVYKK